MEDDDMVYGAEPLFDVVGVAVIGDHKLRLLFDDGTVGDVSYVGHEWKGIFTPLLAAENFAKVTVVHGTLYWPDWDLDIAPEPLYEAAKAAELQPPVKSAA